MSEYLLGSSYPLLLPPLLVPLHQEDQDSIQHLCWRHRTFHLGDPRQEGKIWLLSHLHHPNGNKYKVVQSVNLAGTANEWHTPDAGDTACITISGYTQASVSCPPEGYQRTLLNISANFRGRNLLVNTSFPSPLDSDPTINVTLSRVYSVSSSVWASTSIIVARVKNTQTSKCWVWSWIRLFQVDKPELTRQDWKLHMNWV